MKKLFIICSVLLLVIPNIVKAEAMITITEDDLFKNAKSAVVLSVDTSEYIYEKNSHEKMPVASLTKMVALTLIMEEIEKGDLSLDDKVTASKNAKDMGGSQIWLEEGEVLTVRDMLKSIVMASANDATVAMAEHLAGTEANFVKRMNEYVKNLGLTDTVFKNCTGLDEDGHFSTAYDLSVIANELIKHELIFEFSSKYEDYIREDTDKPYWIVNTNKVVFKDN